MVNARNKEGGSEVERWEMKEDGEKEDEHVASVAEKFQACGV